MTTTGVSTLKWILLAMTVIRSSGTKRNWHTILGKHIRKGLAFIVMSNLVKLLNLKGTVAEKYNRKKYGLFYLNVDVFFSAIFDPF